MSPGSNGRRGGQRLRILARATAAALGTIFVTASILGCGLKGAPQPPSLHLAKTIHNLSAARVGDRIDLHWTTPKETTDRLRIRKPVEMRICRQLPAAECRTVATIFADPGKQAAYKDTLPSALAKGPLREIQYQVFAINRNGRTAGPSNVAPALAGVAPPPIEALSASTVPRGVLLRWRPADQLLPNTAVRFKRTLLTPPKLLQKPAASGLPPVAEPAEQILRVSPESLPSNPGETGSARALDATAAFGRTYRYRAARVRLVRIGNLDLQAESAPSDAVTILTRDTFPPAVPTGLAAVPVSGAVNHGTPEIDLSWIANTEPDLSGYILYRRDVSENLASSAKEQIAPRNGSEPIPVSAFRDLDVQPGHTYRYSVVAVDRSGNRSAPSAEVTATLPSR